MITGSDNKDARKTVCATGPITGFLSMNQNGTTPLHIAAREYFKEVVELLLGKGADANAADKVGRFLKWRWWALKIQAFLLQGIRM
jgi:hypothetical protein